MLRKPTDLRFVNARLIDPERAEPFEGELCVENGFIAQAPAPQARVIDCRGLCLAPGLVDWGVQVGEPGARHKESYASAGRAAAAGGVTTMITRPDTQTPIDSPEILEFSARRAADVTQVRVHHMAALTKGRAGREMTEIGFLMDGGAIAFSDCARVIRDTKIYARALSYARSLGALVVTHPQEPVLSEGACATEGKFASLKGLPDVSPMAERMGLQRDLALAEMTGARIHIDAITTNAALPALLRAKSAGVDVTAGVGIHHLTFNELDIDGFRSFFKFTPPLRSEQDRCAAVEAVASGLIDVICSFHTPQDEESKRLPFEMAAAGAVGLQTLLPAALRLCHSGDLSLPQLWQAISRNPAKRLGLPVGRLAVGAPADLVLFDPDAPFVLDRFSLLSKSKNTPFDGARMQGQVEGTWVSGRQIYGEQD